MNCLCIKGKHPCVNFGVLFLGTLVRRPPGPSIKRRTKLIRVLCPLSFGQQFSGDRGRTPRVAGAVRVSIHSKPAPSTSRRSHRVVPDPPRLSDDCRRNTLQWNKPLTLENSVHDIQPGDQVYIKKWITDPLRESWCGPHQVMMTTYTAVKVQGMDAWIHYTRVKKAPFQWETQIVSPTRMIFRAKPPS
ncbi:uncharacterized protein LOC141727126 isoform X2 [Zonotrichia albicollis]|uniref:uncharacterized protein LOC141727126 isoform X2 n=1 Tax=Zonotrichia albicollis TaxID=44394 RepID=UPI003D80E3B7